MRHRPRAMYYSVIAGTRVVRPRAAATFIFRQSLDHRTGQIAVAARQAPHANDIPEARSPLHNRRVQQSGAEMANVRVPLRFDALMRNKRLSHSITAPAAEAPVR